MNMDSSYSQKYICSEVYASTTSNTHTQSHIIYSAGVGLVKSPPLTYQTESVFYMPDALPASQETVSKLENKTFFSFIPG